MTARDLPYAFAEVLVLIAGVLVIILGMALIGGPAR